MLHTSVRNNNLHLYFFHPLVSHEKNAYVCWQALTIDVVQYRRKRLSTNIKEVSATLGTKSWQVWVTLLLSIPSRYGLLQKNLTWSNLSLLALVQPNHLIHQLSSWQSNSHLFAFCHRHIHLFCQENLVSLNVYINVCPVILSNKTLYSDYVLPWM